MGLRSGKSPAGATLRRALPNAAKVAPDVDEATFLKECQEPTITESNNPKGNVTTDKNSQTDQPNGLDGFRDNNEGDPPDLLESWKIAAALDVLSSGCALIWVVVAVFPYCQRIKEIKTLKCEEKIKVFLSLCWPVLLFVSLVFSAIWLDKVNDDAFNANDFDAGFEYLLPFIFGVFSVAALCCTSLDHLISRENDN